MSSILKKKTHFIKQIMQVHRKCTRNHPRRSREREGAGIEASSDVPQTASSALTHGALQLPGFPDIFLLVKFQM